VTASYLAEKECPHLVSVAQAGHASRDGARSHGDYLSGATDFARLWPADRFMFEQGGYCFLGLHQGPLMKMGDGHWAPQDVRWLRETLKKLPDPNQPRIVAGKRIIEEAYERAKKILTEHLDQLHTVAQALLERESLDAEDIKILLNNGTPPPLKKKASTNAEADIEEAETPIADGGQEAQDDSDEIQGS